MPPDSRPATHVGVSRAIPGSVCAHVRVGGLHGFIHDCPSPVPDVCKAEAARFDIPLPFSSIKWG